MSAAAERRLITISAGTAAWRDGHREQARALLGATCWATLAETLRGRRLLTTLGPRILELAGEQAAPSFARDTEEAIAAARRQARLLQLAAGRVTDTLSGAGIRSIVLKGPELAERIHGDIGRRVSKDIDILVAQQQLAAAAELVVGLGYQPPGDPVDRERLPRLHFTMIHARAALPTVELHWRVHWYERRFAGERLLAPEPRDELAALLLFYARDGFVELRLAADIAAWWDRYGGQLEPGELSAVTDSYPELARALETAALVAGQTVGLPTETLLARPLSCGRRSRLAARLANPHPRTSASQVYAEIGLIDGLLAPPAGLGAFLRRQLAPPREVLDQRARRSGEERTRSTILYGARLAVRWGVILRYLRGLARAALACGSRGSVIGA
jgi:hypothetical protein